MKNKKRKLNLLMPGTWFCLIFLLLALVDGILYGLSFQPAANIMSAVLGLALFIFIVLLVIEQKQDKAQYERAKALDKEIE